MVTLDEILHVLQDGDSNILQTAKKTNLGVESIATILKSSDLANRTKSTLTSLNNIERILKSKNLKDTSRGGKGGGNSKMDLNINIKGGSLMSLVTGLREYAHTLDEISNLKYDFNNIQDLLHYTEKLFKTINEGVKPVQIFFFHKTIGNVIDSFKEIFKFFESVNLTDVQRRSAQLLTTINEFFNTLPGITSLMFANLKMKWMNSMIADKGGPFQKLVETLTTVKITQAQAESINRVFSITSLSDFFEKLPSIGRIVMARITMKMLNTCVDSIVKTLKKITDKENGFTPKEAQNLSDIVDEMNYAIEGISELFKTTIKAGLLAIPASVMGLLVRWVIKGPILKTLKIFSDKKYEKDLNTTHLKSVNNKINDINSIFKSILKLFSIVTLTGIMAIPAVIGGVATIIGLTLVLLCFKALAAITEKLGKGGKKKVTESIASVNTCMLAIGALFLSTTIAGLLAIPATVGAILTAGAMFIISKLLKTIPAPTSMAKSIVSIGLVVLAVAGLCLALTMISSTKVDFVHIIEWIGSSVMLFGAVAAASLAAIPAAIGALGLLAVSTSLISFAVSLRALNAILTDDMDLDAITINISSTINTLFDNLEFPNPFKLATFGALAVDLTLLSVSFMVFAGALAIWANPQDMDVSEPIYETDSHGNQVMTGMKKTGKVKLDTVACAKNISETVNTLFNGLEVPNIFKLAKSLVLAADLTVLSLSFMVFAGALAVWANMDSMKMGDPVYEEKTLSDGSKQKVLVGLKDSGDPVKLTPTVVAKNISDAVNTIFNGLDKVKTGFLGGKLAKYLAIAVDLTALSGSFMVFAKALSGWADLENLTVYDTEQVPHTDSEGNQTMLVTSKGKESVGKLNATKIAENISTTITEFLNSFDISKYSQKLMSAASLSRNLSSYSKAIVDLVTSAKSIMEMDVSQFPEKGKTISSFIENICSESTMKALDDLDSLEGGDLDVLDSITKNISTLGNVADKNFGNIADGLERSIKAINLLDTDKAQVLSGAFKTFGDVAKLGDTPFEKLSKRVEQICQIIVEQMKGNIAETKNSTKESTDKVVKAINDKNNNNGNNPAPNNKNDKDTDNIQTTEVRLYLNDIEDLGNGWRIVPA